MKSFYPYIQKMCLHVLAPSITSSPYIEAVKIDDQTLTLLWRLQAVLNYVLFPMKTNEKKKEVDSSKQ
jgi:hypothetical protein